MCPIIVDCFVVFLHFPMTYYENDGGGRREEVVPDVTLTIQSDDSNGDYVKLRANNNDGSPPGAAAEPSPPTIRAAVWYWVKLVVLFLFLGFLAVVVLVWVGPYFIDKVCAFSSH